MVLPIITFLATFPPLSFIVADDVSSTLMKAFRAVVRCVHCYCLPRAMDI